MADESDRTRRMALAHLEDACRLAVEAGDYPMGVVIRKVINEHKEAMCPTCGRRMTSLSC